MQIYVADLAAYNAGMLEGEWIDIDGLDADGMQEAIDAVIERTGGEEWAIHDYDGISPSFGEHPDLEKIANLVAGVNTHGEAYKAYVEHVGADYASLADFEDYYQGEWASEEDWAYETMNQWYEIPEALANYIDYNAFLRDCKLGGDVAFEYYNGTHYAFRN